MDCLRPIRLPVGYRVSTMMGSLLTYNADSFEIDLPEGAPKPALPV